MESSANTSSIQIKVKGKKLVEQLNNNKIKVYVINGTHVCIGIYGDSFTLTGQNTTIGTVSNLYKPLARQVVLAHNSINSDKLFFYETGEIIYVRLTGSATTGTVNSGFYCPLLNPLY